MHVSRDELEAGEHDRTMAAVAENMGLVAS